MSAQDDNDMKDAADALRVLPESKAEEAHDVDAPSYPSRIASSSGHSRCAICGISFSQASDDYLPSISITEKTCVEFSLSANLILLPEKGHRICARHIDNITGMPIQHLEALTPDQRHPFAPTYVPTHIFRGRKQHGRPPLSAEHLHVEPSCDDLLAFTRHLIDFLRQSDSIRSRSNPLFSHISTLQNETVRVRACRSWFGLRANEIIELSDLLGLEHIGSLTGRDALCLVLCRLRVGLV